MKITYHAIKQDDEILLVDNDFQASLGTILQEQKHAIDRVFVNGVQFPEWELFIGEDNDHVELYVTAQIETLIGFAISALISLALNFILQALFPAPKKPKETRAQPAFGVAGQSNTLAAGTVKFLVYGKNLVHGHIVASRTDLNTPIGGDLFRRMGFSVVYFMGSGLTLHITLPKLNGTNIFDIPGADFNTRLGEPDQQLFTGHELVHQVYYIGLTIPTPSLTDSNANTPIIVTTKGKADKITLFLSYPSGIFGIRTSGKRIGTIHTGYYDYQIKIKKNRETLWTSLPVKHFQAETKDGLFAAVEIEVPDKDRYDVWIKNTGIRIVSQQSGPSILFNMMETQFIRTAYPGNAALEINGVGSEQIQSLDSLDTSALVCGRIIPTPDPDNKTLIRNWTQSRSSICRDILLDPVDCLGNTVRQEMVDDGGVFRAVPYERAQVNGYDGLEDRDHCDVVLNEARSGWDILKNLTFEGDSRILPIRGRLTYVIDADSEPQGMYSDPGRIKEGTVSAEFGRNDKPANTIIATFFDENQDYKEVPAKLVRRAGLGIDYERPEEVSFISIKRESQVARRMRKYIESIDLIDKFWIFQCGRDGLQNVPTEIIRLSYRTLRDRMGVSAYVADGSTVNLINLDRTITIGAGTYSAYLHHKRNNKIEIRTVANPVGQWGILTVSAPWLEMKTGDIIVIGIADTHINNVKIDDVKRSADGVYEVKTSIHVPSVYEIDNPLPHVTDYINAVVVSQIPRQVILAQVVGNVTDGRAEFKVAPGFDNYRGISTDTAPTYIDLTLVEPAIDDFFNGYTIEINVGSGAIATITDYDGATRRATIDTDPGVTGAQTYKLTSPLAALFSGFKVENSTSSSGPWTFLGSTVTTYFFASGYQASTNFFRITPLSAQGVENTVGRHIIQLTAGDSTPPDPPFSTAIFSSQKQVDATIILNFPLPRDASKVNVEINKDTADGVNLGIRSIDVSFLRDEDNATGTVQVAAAFDMTAQPAGTLVYARANVEDFFNNVSAWEDSDTGVELSAEELEELVDSGSDTTQTPVTNTVTETPVASTTIPAGGLGLDGVAFMLVLCYVTDSNPANNATVTLRLKFKGTTIATLVCRTSDGASSIGTQKAWKIECWFAAIGTQVDQKVYLAKTGPELGGSLSAIYVPSLTIIGKPLANKTILITPNTEPITFLEDMIKSRGEAIGAAATADAVFSIQKNGVEFATMTFAAGQSIATFSSAADEDFDPTTDILTMVTPVVQDLTLSDIGVGLAGIRSGASFDKDVQLIRQTVSGLSTETSGELSLTAQLSTASASLSFVKETTIKDFYVNEVEAA